MQQGYIKEIYTPLLLYLERVGTNSVHKRLAISYIAEINENWHCRKTQNLITVLSKLMTAVVVYRQSMKHMNTVLS